MKITHTAASVALLSTSLVLVAAAPAPTTRPFYSNRLNAAQPSSKSIPPCNEPQKRTWYDDHGSQYGWDAALGSMCLIKGPTSTAGSGNASGGDQMKALAEKTGSKPYFAAHNIGRPSALHHEEGEAAKKPEDQAHGQWPDKKPTDDHWPEKKPTDDHWPDKKPTDDHWPDKHCGTSSSDYHHCGTTFTEIKSYFCTHPTDNGDCLTKAAAAFSNCITAVDKHESYCWDKATAALESISKQDKLSTHWSSFNHEDTSKGGHWPEKKCSTSSSDYHHCGTTFTDVKSTFCTHPTDNGECLTKAASAFSNCITAVDKHESYCWDKATAALESISKQKKPSPHWSSFNHKDTSNGDHWPEKKCSTSSSDYHHCGTTFTDVKSKFCTHPTDNGECLTKAASAFSNCITAVDKHESYCWDKATSALESLSKHNKPSTHWSSFNHEDTSNGDHWPEKKCSTSSSDYHHCGTTFADVKSTFCTHPTDNGDCLTKAAAAFSNCITAVDKHESYCWDKATSALKSIAKPNTHDTHSTDWSSFDHKPTQNEDASCDAKYLDKTYTECGESYDRAKTVYCGKHTHGTTEFGDCVSEAAGVFDQCIKAVDRGMAYCWEFKYLDGDDEEPHGGKHWPEEQEAHKGWSNSKSGHSSSSTMDKFCEDATAYYHSLSSPTLYQCATNVCAHKQKEAAVKEGLYECWKMEMEVKERFGEVPRGCRSRSWDSYIAFSLYPGIFVMTLQTTYVGGIYVVEGSYTTRCPNPGIKGHDCKRSHSQLWLGGLRKLKAGFKDCQALESVYDVDYQGLKVQREICDAGPIRLDQFDKDIKALKPSCKQCGITICFTVWSASAYLSSCASFRDGFNSAEFVRVKAYTSCPNSGIYFDHYASSLLSNCKRNVQGYQLRIRTQVNDGRVPPMSTSVSRQYPSSSGTKFRDFIQIVAFCSDLNE
ncbi:hypothetical protein BC832DRAFT_540216 [Gaertneriomyces semiglobifer]|nr:hypothetical protein BC832DRAFT_540216 [Gaertneriomyces semiglobifer]